MLLLKCLKGLSRKSIEVIVEIEIDELKVTRDVDDGIAPNQPQVNIVQSQRFFTTHPRLPANQHSYSQLKLSTCAEALKLHAPSSDASKHWFIKDAVL